MNAAVHQTGTPSLTVPQTQNTAPVLEFNCLYTHDVRKKAKKWQDGFLRYHTFNKRIMVYDLPRNFVGDLHWKSPVPVQEGDEIFLDEGIVIVHVAENVGATQTDLTELRNVAKKSSRDRAQHTTPVRGFHRHPATSARKGQPVIKHRSLKSLLGKSNAPSGRATLPTQSPYELRNAHNEASGASGESPWKRARTDSGRRNKEEVPKGDREQAVRSHHPLQTEEGVVTDLVNEDTNSELPAGSSHDGFQSQEIDSPSAPTRRSSTEHTSTSPTIGEAPARVAESRVELPLIDRNRKAGLELIAVRPRKKTLLCQNQLSRKSERHGKAAFDGVGHTNANTDETSSSADPSIIQAARQPQVRGRLRQTSRTPVSMEPTKTEQPLPRSSEPLPPAREPRPTESKPDYRPKSKPPGGKVQHSVALDTASHGTAAVMLSRSFQRPRLAVAAETPVPLPVPPDPWSREAFDLFEWRPPDWDEEHWRAKGRTIS